MVTELLFADEISKQTLIEWIDNLTKEKTTREVIDRHYDELIDIYKGEMQKHLKCRSATKTSKKMFRHSLKPWWSEELQSLWDTMHMCELEYVKTPRNDLSFKAKFKKFREAEKTFDKTNKRCKRKHQRQQVDNIEKANVDDPVAFWDFIK